MELLRPDCHAPLALPLFLTAVQAGFPSPAEDYVERRLDLNKHLVRNPPATYFMRAAGDSMEPLIHSGALLVVDCSLEATNGRVVVAMLDGEFTVKRLRRDGARLLLVAENPAYRPIMVRDGQNFEVWGVVVAVVNDRV